MRLSTFLLFLGVFLFVLPGAEAQYRRGKKRQKREPIFGAGVVAGYQVSQIDGDEFTGFDLPGFSAGLRGVIRFTRHDQLRMELLYSQQGSRIEYNTNQGTALGRDRLLRLNYAEVPFLYYHKLSDNEQGHGPGIEVGLAVGRMLNYRIEEDESRIRGELFTDLADNFNRTQISAVAGLSHRFNPQIELSLRASGALTKFYFNEEVREQRLNPSFSDFYGIGTDQYEFLRNLSVNITASYVFL